MTAGTALVNGISLQHERFALAYLTLEDATKAARMAGSKAKEGPNLRGQGNDMLHHPHVQEYISKVTKKNLFKQKITVNRVLKEMNRIGFGNAADLMDETGKCIPPHKWSKEFAATVQAIQVFECDENGIPIKFQVRYWDKPKVLEKIATYLGMFDKPEDTAPTPDDDPNARLWTVKVVAPKQFEALPAPKDDNA